MNDSAGERGPAPSRAPLLVALGVLVAALMGFAFFRGLAEMVKFWNTLPQYSHGYFIPVISAYLIWNRRARLARMDMRGAWSGVLVVVLGVLLMLVGELSTITLIIQYAFVLTLYGVVVSFGGWRLFREIWAPLIFLIFMIPLPIFFYQALAAKLQLLSSEIGVWVIRWFRIPVYLEGNVIDLGVYKLQVVEACSGLKYLFSLTSIAFLCAYLFRVAFWKRAVVFLSSIPITVFMNSFRIGVTGVMVEYGGIKMAEGFMHEFEGLVVFGAALAILFGEMAFLARIGRRRTTLRESFSMHAPGGGSLGPRVSPRLSASFVVAIVLLVGAAITTYGVGSRSEIVPKRMQFADFPDQLHGWHGEQQRLARIYLDKLKLSDYILSNYTSPDYGTVNFYVAYYASQAAGESAHSPRSCMPGGGWLIKSIDQRTLPGVEFDGRPARVNRVLIEMGDTKQVVYYWFQQRGRDITNEYLVKWYLFWDALTRNRTDGSLVRLTTLVQPGETVDHAESRLTRFAHDMSGELQKYIPD